MEAAIQLFERDLWSQYTPGQGQITSRQLCERFALFCSVTFDCELVTLWSLDPLNNHLILMAAEGASGADLDTPIMDCGTGLSGKTVERRWITVFRDTEKADEGGRQLLHAKTRSRLGLKHLISVPVLCTSNRNQVLLILNLFPPTIEGLPLDQQGELPMGTGLHSLADAFAQTYERCLRDQGIRLASRLNLRLAKIPKEMPVEKCEAFCKLIQEALNCDAVILYLEDSSRRDTVRKASSGAPPPRSIEKIMRRTEARNVWANNRERLIHGLRRQISLEDRSIRRAFDQDEFLAALVPIRDLDGRAEGTVLCLNRCLAADTANWRLFTYEDAAIIEAVSEAFAPHLAVILADEQRNDLLSKVAHELRVPVVALRAVLERIETECNVNGWVFRYPYFREVKNYTLLLSLLLKNLDAVRKGAHFVPLEPSPTRLVPAIMAPTKRFLAPLLRQRGFQENQIQHFGLEDLPVLYVDTLLMMQVVFNLLENAIKYYRGQANKFLIEIEGKRDEQRIQIFFRDWGIGVPEIMREEIFQAGVRAENARGTREPGDGLGLWFARELVQRHGGSLVLNKCALPTEFVIELPASIEQYPPKMHEQDSPSR